MPIQALPENPSYENLKKRAKELRDAVRSGDRRARARVAELHPRGDREPADFALADAQLVVARGYGFASWAKLKQHLAVVERWSWDPSAAPAAESLADRFVRSACLVYGDWHPERAVEAERLLAAHPEIPATGVAAAAASGDTAALATLLERNPESARQRSGALGWEPLLYACYSRLAPTGARSTVAAARELLARGADPNAGVLWCGNVPPFTALSGAFGEGEDGNNQPPHPERDALARLLLEAGADPNDGQTLYNRHFRRDDGHLRLLLAHGLGGPRRGPWGARLGERLETPARLRVEELWAAARKGYVERVQLLLAHGVDVDTPGLRDGRTPHEAATMTGNRAIAELLLAHGARAVALEPAEAFAAACLAGDGAGARALLKRDPGLLERFGPHGRAELVHRAVEADRQDGLRLLAVLGCEVGAIGEHRGVGSYRSTTPLHNAAWAGNLPMVELLLALGADPRARDPRFDATPLGWAIYNRQREVVERLLPLADGSDPADARDVAAAQEISKS